MKACKIFEEKRDRCVLRCFNNFVHVWYDYYSNRTMLLGLTEPTVEIG